MPLLFLILTGYIFPFSLVLISLARCLSVLLVKEPGLCRFKNNKDTLQFLFVPCLISGIQKYWASSMNFERDLDILFMQNLYFLNFEECEILLDEFDRSVLILLFTLSSW